MHAIKLAHASAVNHAVNLITDPRHVNFYMHLVQHPKRTLEQNALMWPYLEQFAAQLDWPIWSPRGWIEQRMTVKEWKDFLTAGYRRETATIAQGMDNRGYVLVGTSTSDMDKVTFSEFIEFMQAFAAQHGVDLDRNYKRMQ